MIPFRSGTLAVLSLSWAFACTRESNTGVGLSAEPDGSVVEDVSTVAADGSAVVATCGDGVCGAGETFLSCPADCPPPPCGNGLCEPGESPVSCAFDCAHACGNKKCESGENVQNCPADCGSACGNGKCEFGESPALCPGDCLDPCGDGLCTEGENPFNCPADCKPPCGNAVCDKGESPESCPTDCLDTVCGDGTCEVNEHLACPIDCCTDCEDGLACTVGKCVGAGKKCVQEVTPGFCLIDNTCIAGGDRFAPGACASCQPAVAAQAWSALGSGPCDDGSACTQGDTCAAGECTGAPLSCDDGNPCTIDGCAAKTGCFHASLAGGCDDGDPCSKGDVCLDDTCVGLPYSCDDGLACTSDICDGAGACGHVQSSGTCLVAGTCYADGETSPANACLTCAPLKANDAFVPASFSPCDDVDACTTGDTCFKGVCVGQPVSCVASNSCVTSTCVNPFGCVESPALCSDGNPCTKDTCEPATGCTFPPLPDTCDDGDLCTKADDCHLGHCRGTPLDCDDGTACTTDGCTKGDCVHVDHSLDCKDQDPCTEDSCDPLLGCVHLDKGLPCDDGNACTLLDLCLGGKCTGTLPITCDDGLPCTVDFCSPSKSCQHVPNQAACNDGVPCTVDLCVSGLGCKHTPTNAACDDGDPCTLDECLGECTHTDRCAVTVFDETEDLLGSHDVRAVVAYDSSRDSAGGAWRSNGAAGWSIEAREQFDGRSVILPGVSYQDYPGTGEPDELSWDMLKARPRPRIDLPLLGVTGSAAPATLTFWLRISGVSPLFSSHAVNVGDETIQPKSSIVHELFITDVASAGSSEEVCLDYTYGRFLTNLLIGGWRFMSPLTGHQEVCASDDSGTDFGAYFSSSCGSTWLPVFKELFLLPKESWVHVAVVGGVGGTENKVYINGALASYSLGSEAKSSVLRIELRSINTKSIPRSYGAPLVTASIDSITFYPVGLTEAQVQSDFDGAGVAAAGLPVATARWTFDAGSTPFSLAGGAYLSRRSSEASFPDLSYVIGGAAGLDILDGDRHMPWMRFELDPLGTRSLLRDGVAAVLATDGVLLLTGTGGNEHTLVDFSSSTPSNYGFVNATQWNAGAAKHVGCDMDLCFASQVPKLCACDAADWDSIACRNRKTNRKTPLASGLYDSVPQLHPDDQITDLWGYPACPGAGGAHAVSPLTVRPSSLATLRHVQETKSLLSPEPEFAELSHARVAGEALYVVSSATDASCQRVTVVPKAADALVCGTSDLCDGGCDACPGSTGFGCLNALTYFLGSLDTKYINKTTACGGAPDLVNDLEVTRKTSIVNPKLNTVYLATNHYVLVLNESTHDWTAPKAIAGTRFSKAGGGNPGHAVLPTGPYTSVVGCGGLVYVGTKSSGVVVLDPKKPDGVVRLVSTPKLGSNEIRDLSCTEIGPQAGLHRVLVATPQGAAEIVGVTQ